MQQAEPPRQPEGILPPVPLRWLGGLVRACLLGGGQLPPEGAVWVVRGRDSLALRTVYGSLFAGRQGVLDRGEGGAADRQANSDRLQAGLDVLIPVAAAADQAHLDLLRAIELARSASRSVLPVGVSAAPAIGFAELAIPLPWARMVVMLDAPFRVPDRPERVPDAWPAAILYLLDRAGGQARETLATWQHSGQPPGDAGRQADW